MRKAVIHFVCLSAFFTITSANLMADGGPQDETYLNNPAKKSSKAFTGKLTKDRVRLRLHPNLDSPVIRELNRGDMLVVVDEVDDFYAVKPTSDIRGYIYRTYILDGVVEGNRVNVRVEPHLEAPVIGQLAQGERVEGTVSEKNPKWLELAPPATTLFYVSSDYIEKVGDANYLANHEKRKEEASHLLNSTYLMTEAELEKPFPQIEADKVIQNYDLIINEYSDFPEQGKRAKQFLTKFNDAYLRKKVEYLESKAQNALDHMETRHYQRPDSMMTQKERFEEPGNQLNQTNMAPSVSKTYEQWASEKYASEISARMALWIPVEITYYDQWARQNGNRPIQEFYDEQKHNAVGLRGVLETYDRPVRNKPGDYLLVNRVNRNPIAYLYSAHVNLQDKVGKEVTIQGVLRPNNNFAYPAYFVLSAE